MYFPLADNTNKLNLATGADVTSSDYMSAPSDCTYSQGSRRLVCVPQVPQLSYCVRVVQSSLTDMSVACQDHVLWLLLCSRVVVFPNLAQVCQSLLNLCFDCFDQHFVHVMLTQLK